MRSHRTEIERGRFLPVTLRAGTIQVRVFGSMVAAHFKIEGDFVLESNFVKSISYKSLIYLDFVPFTIHEGHGDAENFASVCASERQYCKTQTLIKSGLYTSLTSSCNTESTVIRWQHAHVYIFTCLCQCACVRVLLVCVLFRGSFSDRGRIAKAPGKRHEEPSWPLGDWKVRGARKLAAKRSNCSEAKHILHISIRKWNCYRLLELQFLSSSQSISNRSRLVRTKKKAANLCN